MEKPWLASYPEGVAHTIDTSICTDVATLMDHTFETRKAEIAILHMGNKLTFGQVDEYANAFARICVTKSALKRATVWP